MWPLSVLQAAALLLRPIRQTLYEPAGLCTARGGILVATVTFLNWESPAFALTFAALKFFPGLLGILAKMDWIQPCQWLPFTLQAVLTTVIARGLLGRMRLPALLSNAQAMQVFTWYLSGFLGINYALHAFDAEIIGRNYVRP